MNDLEKLSYSLGLNIAKNLQSQGVEELDSKSLASAIEDVLTGSDLKIGLEDSAIFLNEYFGKLAAKQHEATIQEGAAFLKANGARDGVVSLASGLQYEVMTEGTGEKPTINSTVTTHYHGTKIDGTIFDSSVQRGTPASFPVSGVIAGWTEALQLMPVGSKWKLYVPSNLAYGERGAGQDIGPHTTLIFEVELLSIN